MIADLCVVVEASESQRFRWANYPAGAKNFAIRPRDLCEAPQGVSSVVWTSDCKIVRTRYNEVIVEVSRGKEN